MANFLNDNYWESGYCMGQLPLFASFRLFQQQIYRKIEDLSGIRPWIVRVEGKRTDHLTTTTAEICATVGRAVASDTRGPGFYFSH